VRPAILTVRLGVGVEPNIDGLSVVGIFSAEANINVICFLAPGLQNTICTRSYWLKPRDLNLNGGGALDWPFLIFRFGASGFEIRILQNVSKACAITHPLAGVNYTK
jgi:hypothetical protein